MAQWRSAPRELARYLIVGAVNTGLTYALLVALMRVLDYRLAYTLVYALGIALSYWTQSRYVFKVPPRLRTGLAFPLIYLLQYLLGVAVLWLLVEAGGLSKEWAALIAVALNVPVGFALSRALLRSGPGTPPKR